MEKQIKLKRFLLEATDNRIHCSYCSNRINKTEKYFRDSKKGWNNTHTVNICYKCIVKLFLYLNLNDDEICKIKKEIMTEYLSK